MRKTSQDGGDTTSITSGIENESKKPSSGIIKSTRNSIKRKVQNFSNESDEAVIEPLLQKDKPEIANQSAKYLLSKTKTDSINEKESDKDKLLSEKLEKPSMTSIPGITDVITHTNNIKAPIHNHMNTNVFSNHDGPKGILAPKSPILVEIGRSKHSSYSPSPLIFTTAKIHTDGKTKHMEPVQVTPVPILSTTEGGVVKANIIDNDKTLGEKSKKAIDVSNVSIKPFNSNDVKVTTAKSYAESLRKEITANVTAGDNKIYNTPITTSSSYSKAQPSTKDYMSNITSNDKIKNTPTTSLQKTNSLKKCNGDSSTKLVSSLVLEKNKTQSTDINSGQVQSNKSSDLENSYGKINRQNNIDVNKNIQIESSAGSQKSGICVLTKSTVDTKPSLSDLSNKNKILETVSGSNVNKQLERQKCTNIEDTDNLKDNSMSSANISTTSSLNKSQKDSIDTSITPKNKIESKVNKSGVSKSSIGKSQKFNCGDLTDTAIKISTNLSITVPAIACKSSSIMTPKTSVNTVPLNSTVKSATTLATTPSTTTISTASKSTTKVATTVMPSTILTTRVTSPKLNNSTTVITQDTATNAIKSSSISVPSTNPAKTSTVSTIKSPSSSAKTILISNAKVTPVSSTSISSAGKSTSSSIINPITSKSIVVSANKALTTTQSMDTTACTAKSLGNSNVKSVATTAAAPSVTAAKPSVPKQCESKSSELIKDGKSSKA